MAKLIARRHSGWTRSRVSRALIVLDKRMASEAQFRELFEQHRAYLHGLALRLSGNAEAAKDLVQETFKRAWERFDQFQPGTNVRAWLATILTNVYFDQRKHEKVVEKAMQELRLLDDREDGESEAMLSTLPDAYLHAAIEALEPELREVIELCCLQQMRYREAAEKLGVPPGTIGTRLMRARASLKVLLAAMLRKHGMS